MEGYTFTTLSSLITPILSFRENIEV